MLYFFTTLAIGHLPSLDLRSVVIHLRSSRNRAVLPTCKITLRVARLVSSSINFRLSIHSAVNGKIRPGNIGGLRTRNECYHRADPLNMPIAIQGSRSLPPQCPTSHP